MSACQIDVTDVIAVVAAIGVAYTTAALKLRRPHGTRTRDSDRVSAAGDSEGDDLA